jgi:ribonuclease D
LVRRIFGLGSSSTKQGVESAQLQSGHLISPTNPAPEPELAREARPQNAKKKAHKEYSNNNRLQRRNPELALAGQAAPGTLVEAPPFRMITSTQELEEAVATFAPHSRIALDTEADSLHCYFDKLCLVQITIPGANYLIDPLAGFSLDPLFTALEGKTVIIHSADYDLRLLRRCGYEGPTVLFDTMIAARLCGATEFGLAALLHQYFGVTLAKASQKANWARRPLPPEMLAYAVNDTLNLLTLAKIQEARLRELGRWEWFEQMCEKAIRSAAFTRERDPDTLWRISGYADLSARGSAILRALWNWRDQEAQSVDKPAFHILNNDLLLAFSAEYDKGQAPDPRHVRGPRLTRMREAVESALALSEEDYPKAIRKPRLRTTQEQEAKFKELRTTRDKVAEKLALDPTLIAPKATLEQLSRNEEQAYEGLMPWQRECLGL